ncbi:DinB family protein [Streptomyces graminofaciens]|jgi:hypothetical protein|nr:DinB family protein [Streptomyces graminofaciens]
MTIKRTEPSTTADERATLEGFLDYHRQTLHMKCEGLTDAQLRTAAVPPSGLTLLGLVRHMAEVERWWFRHMLVDNSPGNLFWTDEDPDGDFHPTEQDTWESTYTAWQAEIDAARSNAAPLALDDLSANKRKSSGESFTLRWIYTHMIEEYARHNGHADLLRELIDGTTGE